jgi:Ni/Co efflux regulator RcnB
MSRQTERGAAARYPVDERRLEERSDSIGIQPSGDDHAHVLTRVGAARSHRSTTGIRMMNKLMSLSLVALLAGASAAVDAAPRDNDWRGDRGRHGQHHDRHDDHRRGGRENHRDYRRDGDNRYGDGRKHYRQDQRHAYRHDNRHWNHGGYRPHHGRHDHRYRAPAYYARPHGYRPHRWASGHYLPRHYYGPSYYVDYHNYRLAPPPYGHHWVRVDNDVLLVALATGLIADTVYGLFY